MCGIAGGFNNIVVSKMLETLSHRGSDSVNIKECDGIFVGHTRLDIIGDQGDCQPIVVDNVTVTFNGEIYNYLDLRTDLIRRGYRFKTSSDSEVIATAYKYYGSVFVEKLDGIFAFALYDSAEKKLFLCRDRVGVKPLYYTNNNGFYFMSEIKAYSNLFSCSVNQDALCEYITFQYCLKDTLFDGVYKVNPGEMLEFSKDGELCKTIPYWDISESILKRDFDKYYTSKYYEDHLLYTIHKAVRNQIPTVPFGVYVSGGLDSGAIASLISEYTNEFKLFTGRYDLAHCDESGYAEEVAKFVDKPLCTVDISEKDVVDNLSDAIYHLDEPVAGPGLIGQYILAKRVKQEYPDLKVVFGGQGGDELFGGYARYIVAYLECCIYGSIYPKDRDYVIKLNSLAPIMPVLQGYEPMMISFFSNNMFYDKWLRYFSLVARSDNTELDIDFYNSVYIKQLDRIKEEFFDVMNNKGSVSYFTKMSYFDFKKSLPALLQVDDRVNGAFSMEGRFPILDENVIDFAFSIPPEYKFSGGYSKGLFRKSLAGTLPESVLTRRDKMGFPVPMKEWYNKKGIFYNFVNDTLKSNGSTFSNVFKAPKEFNRSTWGHLSLSLWSNLFNV
jgi:asparagine synthase (glutamine-hydrolysing)